MQIRTVAGSLVSFVILLLIMSYAMNRGAEEVSPRLQASQNRAEAQNKLLKSLVAQDLSDLGVDPGLLGGDLSDILEQGLAGINLQAVIARPVGTWMGVRKSGTSNSAYIKFEKERYWIKTKDENNRNISEKGRYEYSVVEIIFYPENKTSYRMQYEMISPEYIQLFGPEISYNLERTEEIGFAF